MKRMTLAALLSATAVFGWQPAAHAIKTDIPNVKIPDIKVPHIDLPKIDVPKVDLPKVEVPKIDVPKIDVPKINVPDVKVGVPEAPRIKPTSPVMGKLPANPGELPSVPKNIPPTNPVMGKLPDAPDAPKIKPANPVMGKLPDNPNAPKVKPANPVMGKLPDNPNAPKIYDKVPAEKVYTKLPPEPNAVMGKLPADPNAPKVKPAANPVMGRLPDNPNAPKIYDKVPAEKVYTKLPPEPNPVMGKLPDNPNTPKVKPANAVMGKLPGDPNAPKVQYGKLPDMGGTPADLGSPAQKLGAKVDATAKQIDKAGINKLGQVAAPGVGLPTKPLVAAAPNAGVLTKVAKIAPLPSPKAIVDAVPSATPAVAKKAMSKATKIKIAAGVTMITGAVIGLSAPHIVQKIVGDEPAPEQNTVE